MNVAHQFGTLVAHRRRVKRGGPEPCVFGNEVQLIGA